MKKITAYKCDHCKKHLISKQGMKKHESRCFRNPETKSCITCDHFNQDLEVRQCDSTGEALHKLKTGCWRHKIINNNWEDNAD